MAMTVVGVCDRSGRDLTGKATFVTLVGGHERSDRPPVLDRRECDLAANGAHRRVFHIAQAAALGDAERLITAAAAAAELTAIEVLAGIVSTMAEEGHTVGALALAIDEGGDEEQPPLAEVLESHTALHRGEALLYRDAVLAAAEAHGIEVVRYVRRDLEARTAAALGLPRTAIADRLTEMGAAAGRPWRQDHRQAALAAWMVVAEA